MSAPAPGAGLVERYVLLGLQLGRHIPGLVDAYYGPPHVAARVAAEPLVPPGALAAAARRLLADLDAGLPLDGDTGGDPAFAPVAGAETDDVGAGLRRRHYLRAQVRGLLTTAEVLAGARLAYAEEVERCYGVRPRRIPEDEVVAAHRRLEEVVPGSGPLRERLVAWRESHAIPVDRLEAAIAALVEELRARTARLFGLPEGERVDVELVSGKPWSGFNYYLGGLRSRVAVNVDLPVLSTSLPHLVAHEAYPGHHSEHSTKEVRLVRRRGWWEESIFLVGTPQCLVSEGLADLGLEVVMGPRPEPAVAPLFAELRLPYDADVVGVVAEAGEVLASVRANAAFRLHEDGAPPAEVAEELGRLALLPPARAEKAVEFLADPVWRTYVTCYVEGLPLCRRFVAGDASRFARLLREQLTPDELGAAWRAGEAAP